ncbi:hypothetical protein Tter_0824 [Thermobaculum terrenum ATCC BAA-798]|uniref:Uncharacterized protein n=1 Tax=Thermobaculum terrenum (strain ATCC BAA-798 / CCMEE 7001 / YNP1) TaxID=525904 RepID=D1CFN5_THET1|nr:hypothetical protein [Thermobaculum terrenum]ACZ41741.1 hypothetical protein Tter_0824 [Thermobaculum terrenum ATCC BAA-798]
MSNYMNSKNEDFSMANNTSAGIEEEFSRSVNSVKVHIESLKNAALREIEELNKRHEAEKQELRERLQQLSSKNALLEDNLRKLREKIGSLLEDYKKDLESQVQEAYAARRQLDRVQNLMNTLEDISVVSAGEPGHEHVLRLSAEPDMESQEERVAKVTMNLGQVAESTKEPQDEDVMKIKINGISTVSAMLKARKAVEDLPDIIEVQNRQVAGGVAHFTVRTPASPEDIVSKLTSSRNAQLRLVEVRGREIELQNVSS